jgi:hypothetical protein
MKVYTTKNPEAAARQLAETYESVVVRRDVYARPHVAIRTSRLADLRCYMHYGQEYERQLRNWEANGGVLFTREQRYNVRGLSCDAMLHSDVPPSLQYFVNHTAFVRDIAVLSLPVSWDGHRRQNWLRFPPASYVRPVFERIMEWQSPDEAIRRRACELAGISWAAARVMIGDEMRALFGGELNRRESVGLRETLFPRRAMPEIQCAVPRIRPVDDGNAQAAYDWLMELPADELGRVAFLVNDMAAAVEKPWAALYRLEKYGHVVTFPALYALDVDKVDPDFGFCDVNHERKGRLLEAMIRYVESLEELPSSS